MDQVRMMSSYDTGSAKSRISRLTPALATALVAFGTMFAPAAHAGCGVTTGNFPTAASLKGKSGAPRLPGLTSALGFNSGIAGLWNVTFTSGGQVVDFGFDQWNNDGTEVLNDATPPLFGNICLGVWKKTSPAAYKLYHPSLVFDENGMVTGTAVFDELLTVAPDGNTYSGTYTLDFYDLDGNPLAHYSGEISATRITAG